MKSPSEIAEIAAAQAAFAQAMGVRVVSATLDRLELAMEVTPGLLNRNGMLHGGAIMALADSAGGTATFINIPEGFGTVTVESKTSFFRPLALGDEVRAVCTPLHRGRKTQVWQTEILRPDGKLAALVIQTQMVLPPAA